MNDVITYQDAVTVKREYKNVEISLDDLWENWKDQDTSIVKPLIILVREKNAEIQLLKQNLQNIIDLVRDIKKGLSDQPEYNKPELARIDEAALSMVDSLGAL